MAVCVHPKRRGYISYDWDHCLLAENTWVDIQAEITPEYQRGGPNANNTVSFSLYIDNSGPFQAEDISLYVEEMNTPFGTHKIYFYNIPCSEKWFPDYSISLDLRYNESTGQWGGSGYSAMYDGSPLPMYLDSASMSATFSHGTNRIDDCDKVLDVAIDCAGNTSVAVFEQGEAMGNYVNLAAEKTILDPGETLTIRNTAENQYDMQIEWTNNNPEILEILESDGYSCTIRALAPGAASVSGGFGPYAKSLDITVRDRAGAHCRAVSGHCKSLGQGRSSPPSRRASSAEPAPTPSPRRPPSPGASWSPCSTAWQALRRPPAAASRMW